jgi:3-methyladenine DNA glycosylase/8-oxoguanine DNA glycosylase
VLADGTSISTVVRPRLPIDLRLSLTPLFRGGGGGIGRADADGSWWRATRTPLGPAVGRYAATHGGVEVRAWGAGAAWVVETAPELLGARDSIEGFDPGPGLVRELHGRMPGLRVTRSRAVFEAIVPTVLAQKVTGLEAGRAWKALVRAHGEPAPGPRGLLLPPSPSALAALPYHAFHPFGVEMRRANVIRVLAARSERLERAQDLPNPDARRLLMAFPGVGAWTAAEVAIVALGDADAVSIGDFHVPNTIAWALAGEPRGTDERMLELLAPFGGHRGRVIRLIEAGGFSAPRFGPKATVRSMHRV